MTKSLTFKILGILSIAMVSVCFPAVSFAKSHKVKPGIEVLEERGFSGLVGKRVGLVTNPSGVDTRLRSTIGILHEAKGVELVALFGPEHGVRGDAYAGDVVSDSVDPQTGVKVFSIYGKYREPSQEMLDGIDVMVYDIQDVGTRSGHACLREERH